VIDLQLSDNTVLVNFARIRRIDLLERLLNGKGSWTATVEIECAESAEVVGLEQLTLVRGFLGEPLRLESDDERLRTEEIRERLRIPGDDAFRNLGESESLAIIHTRDLRAVFVTDDTGALREARRIEVETACTATLLVLAAKIGWISTQECWDYICELRKDGHYLPDCPESMGDLMARCGMVS
jgi:predicted nucleic acid-binding protein